MKKTTLGLILACLFITSVMIYLMISGVHLTERRMVKWSDVASAEEAGEKVGLFMYPVIGEFRHFLFLGEDTFTDDFFKGFKKVEEPRGRSVQLVLNERPLPETNPFVLRIENIDQDFIESCRKQIKWACVGIKAKKKLEKKPLSSKPIWISMYRLSNEEAVLYYRIY